MKWIVTALMLLPMAAQAGVRDHDLDLQKAFEEIAPSDDDIRLLKLGLIVASTNRRWDNVLKAHRSASVACEKTLGRWRQEMNCRRISPEVVRSYEDLAGVLGVLVANTQEIVASINQGTFGAQERAAAIYGRLLSNFNPLDRAPIDGLHFSHQREWIVAMAAADESLESIYGVLNAHPELRPAGHVMRFRHLNR